MAPLTQVLIQCACWLNSCTLGSLPLVNLSTSLSMHSFFPFHQRTTLHYFSARRVWIYVLKYNSCGLENHRHHLFSISLHLHHVPGFPTCAGLGWVAQMSSIQHSPTLVLTLEWTAVQTTRVSILQVWWFGFNSQTYSIIMFTQKHRPKHVELKMLVCLLYFPQESQGWL